MSEHKSHLILFISPGYMFKKIKSAYINTQSKSIALWIPETGRITADKDPCWPLSFMFISINHCTWLKCCVSEDV